MLKHKWFCTQLIHKTLEQNYKYYQVWNKLFIWKIFFCLNFIDIFLSKVQYKICCILIDSHLDLVNGICITLLMPYSNSIKIHLIKFLWCQIKKLSLMFNYNWYLYKMNRSINKNSIYWNEILWITILKYFTNYCCICSLDLITLIILFT